MPRRVIRAGGNKPPKRSLGWLALAWMETLTVHGPGDVQGEPVVHPDEVSEFIADCYAVDRAGQRLYDSAFLSRPKGCDKSGLGGRIALFEALGPCRFAGWAKGGEVYRDPWDLGFEYVYERGEPMGAPVRSPFVRCMATEEGQTGNVYDTVYVNLTEGPLARIPGLDAGLTRVFLPGGGEIVPSTASSSSKDGGRETFVVFDETHLYTRPELRRMYGTVTRNLRKRKKSAPGTWYLETTTMFAPGEESTAEATYLQAERIVEGKARRQRLLFDHRWGECEDLADEKALREALRDAYGDVDWIDLDGLVDEFHDLRADVTDSRRYFLNAPTQTADAWLAAYEWAARADVAKIVRPGDPVVLGFDGSKRRARGVTDATALIGCRVSDGHVFEIEVWEQPTGPAGADWEVPAVAVDAAVRDAFKRYNVVGFFADPAKWETYVAAWEADFGRRLKVKASTAHPIEWWMTGGSARKTVQALDEYHTAVVDGLMTHDGSSALTRHHLNARRRSSRNGIQIAKENPLSPRKIDAAVASTLAWAARLEAVAKGLGKASSSVPARIR